MAQQLDLIHEIRVGSLSVVRDVTDESIMPLDNFAHLLEEADPGGAIECLKFQFYVRLPVTWKPHDRSFTTLPEDATPNEGNFARIVSAMWEGARCP